MSLDETKNQTILALEFLLTLADFVESFNGASVFNKTLKALEKHAAKNDANDVNSIYFSSSDKKT